MVYGILVEKPSAARNFATALGGMSGSFNGEQYVITNARGHLYEFADPKEQVPASVSDQYKSWNMKHLPWNEKDFSWKRVKKDGASDTLKQIKQTLSKCDAVVIATDVDPSGEGELLAWEILDELALGRKPTYRMYFMDESVKEIQKAFKDKKKLPSMAQDMDYVKAEYRARWDMLSMQFTRIATGCTPNRSVLRQGRLKSAMVKIVGDGLKALAEYKKVPFYMNKFKDENGVVYTNPEEPKCPDKAQVPNVYHDSDVVKDGSQMKATAPPKLLDLAALSSRLASHGFKAKTVLDVYQKMYEAQIVSYPRTEDKFISPEQFNDLLPKVDAIAKVVGVDPKLLTHRTPRSTHVKTGGAHGANRPGLRVPGSLDDLKTFGACAPMIYEVLAKNYLAILCEDYEYEQQKGHIKDYSAFKGTASIPKKMGWKQVFNDESDSDEDENVKGIGTHADPFIAEGANPKPPVPTMKWLMKQLEKYDVGTGATRTSTYADVTSDKAKFPLMKETRGKLSMTEYGDMSYVLLEGTLIGDVKMTEQLQQEMKAVSEGKLNPADGLKKVRDYVVHDMDVMLKNSKKLGGNGMAGNGNGNGNGNFMPKEKYDGVWKGKQVSFTRAWGGHRFTDEECEKLCAGEEIELKDCVSKSGSTYAVRGVLAEQEYNGRKFVGFQRTGFGDSGIPDEFSGHKFTADEKALLELGKELFISDFVSRKTGRTFSCGCSYGEREDGRKGFILNFDRKS